VAVSFLPVCNGVRRGRCAWACAGSSTGKIGPATARGSIATSHAARENFIRIMPGVAQAIEEVLRSGHVPRAHGRLFAI
jgi:hypothetical protein